MSPQACRRCPKQGWGMLIRQCIVSLDIILWTFYPATKPVHHSVLWMQLFVVACCKPNQGNDPGQGKQNEPTFPGRLPCFTWGLFHWFSPPAPPSDLNICIGPGEERWTALTLTQEWSQELLKPARVGETASSLHCFLVCFNYTD